MDAKTDNSRDCHASKINNGHIPDLNIGAYLI